jgi:hypothetical protein
MKSLLSKAMLAGLISLLLIQSSFALGVSPLSSTFENLKNTSVLQGEFFVSRGYPTNSQTYILKTSGNGAAAITLETEKLTLHPEESSAKVKYELKPKDLAPGEYTIDINVTEDSSQSTNMAIGVSIGYTIFFSVTEDDFISFNTSNLWGLQNKSNVEFGYRVENKSNVEISDFTLEVEYKDVWNEDLETINEILTHKEPIPPFSTENIALKSLLELTPSVYKLNMKLYDAKGELLEEKDSTLQIHEQKLNKTPILLASIVLLAMIIAFISKKLLKG